MCDMSCRQISHSDIYSIWFQYSSGFQSMLGSPTSEHDMWSNLQDLENRIKYLEQSAKVWSTLMLMGFYFHKIDTDISVHQWLEWFRNHLVYCYLWESDLADILGHASSGISSERFYKCSILLYYCVLDDNGKITLLKNE